MVVEFTQESAQKIFGGDLKLHLLLFINKTKTEAQPLINTLQEAAPKYHGKVSARSLLILLETSIIIVA